MRILVLANGDATGDKMAGRHFVDVDGEPLLERTVRQFAPHGDVIVSGPDLRYKVDGAALYVPRAEPEHLDADIVLSTRALWAGADRTLVLLGDTIFSDAAVSTIVETAAAGWFYIGRANGSRFSGTDYGELFGLAFGPADQPRLLATALELVDRQRAGLWRAGMWEHYRLLNGFDPLEHRIDARGHFLEIDDETDDVDYAEAFDRWRAATGRA